MEAEIVEKQGVALTLKVTVPAQDVDAAFESVLTRLSRTIRVPGFRPGRAPRGVVERRIGEEALKEEVREQLVDVSYPEAVRKLELSPIDAHFHADLPEKGAAFEFTVHAESYPEVALPDIGAIEVAAAPRAYEDAMLEQAVAQLQRENAVLVPVDRPVERDDWVLLETVTQEDFDAQGATSATGDSEGSAGSQDASNGFPVDLESAGDELRDQLAGSALGSIAKVELSDETVPDEDGNPSKRALYLKVHDVKGKERPQAGDEFAAQLGVANWQEVEERLKASIEADLAREGYDARRNELIEKLVAGAELDLPNSLVRRRQQSLLEDLAADLKRQGQTFESYLRRLEARGKREEFEAELKEAAERGVKRDLVLEKLLETRGAEVDDAEFNDAVKSVARQRRQDVGTFMSDMGEDWLRNYRFLLARDKAVRELVVELTGDEYAKRIGVSEAAGEAADSADAAEAEAEHDHHHDHGHDHDHHGHDHDHDHEHGHDH